MPGKIFINYRRDDARDMAARIRDRLAGTFGDANVFMDVDNLVAGQRFDKELERALGETDVFIAVIGSRWLELLTERQGNSERDYVREEIARGLQKGLIVIPVLIERTPLPRADALPADIRHIVLHQKHTVTHEQFGRDVARLVDAIRFSRRAVRAGAGKGTAGWVGTVGVASLLALVAGGALLGFQWASMPWSTNPGTTQQIETKDVQPRWPALQEAKRARPEPTEPASVRVDQIPPAKVRVVAAAAKADPWQPGRVFRDCSDCPEMVVLPAGEFMMGSPPDDADRADTEGPRRKVMFERPFAVGKFEVTFAEWDACVAEGGCKHTADAWRRVHASKDLGRRPANDVSWNDAQEFTSWLSRKTGKTYRLLSEAEWEYAARAGTTTPYSTGQTIAKSQANFGNTKLDGMTSFPTVDVGSFPPNSFGLHDMHGNVEEWVEDCWNANYNGAPSDGSAWTTGDCGRRPLRGGSWVNNTPQNLRSAYRSGSPPDLRGGIYGFRVGRTL